MVVFLWSCRGPGADRGWFEGHPYPQSGLPEADVRVGDVPLRVEIARTTAQIQIGLMGRREVPEGTGMLFLFPDAREHWFWMRNCPVDLDVAFFGADRRLIRHFTMKAYDTDSSRYYSGGPAQYALEARAGFFGAHGVQVGDELHLPPSVLKIMPGKDE